MFQTRLQELGTALENMVYPVCAEYCIIQWEMEQTYLPMGLGWEEHSRNGIVLKPRIASTAAIICELL